MPAFVAGAVEGDTKSMMTSYHALNGIPASASPVIRSELREALGPSFALSTLRYPFVWLKGVRNGYSSTRVSLWDSLMFGRVLEY